MLSFKLDPVQIFCPFFRGAIPQQTQSYAQASKGRTQFVRNISQQSLLGLNKGLNSPRHVVEAQTETANFISAPSNTLVASRIKLAARNSSGRFTQLHYGPGDVSSEPETKNASDQQNHKKAKKCFKSKSLEQRQERRARKDQKHRVSIPADSLHPLSGNKDFVGKVADARSIFPGIFCELGGPRRWCLAQNILSAFVEEGRLDNPALFHSVKMLLQTSLASAFIQLCRMPRFQGQIDREFGYLLTVHRVVRTSSQCRDDHGYADDYNGQPKPQEYFPKQTVHCALLAPGYLW